MRLGSTVVSTFGPGGTDTAKLGTTRSGLVFIYHLRAEFLTKPMLPITSSFTIRFRYAAKIYGTWR